MPQGFSFWEKAWSDVTRKHKIIAYILISVAFLPKIIYLCIGICVNHIDFKLQIMNLKHFLFTIFLLLTFSASIVNAQNRDAYYPQVPFDSVQAKDMLGLGKSSIE